QRESRSLPFKRRRSGGKDPHLHPCYLPVYLFFLGERPAVEDQGLEWLPDHHPAEDQQDILEDDREGFMGKGITCHNPKQRRDTHRNGKLELPQPHSPGKPPLPVNLVGALKKKCPYC